MVDLAPEVDSALLGLTVFSLLSVFGGLGTVSVFSAMLGPLWYMLCVSHLVLLVRQCRKLDFLLLPFVDFLSWCRGPFSWSCLFGRPWRLRCAVFFLVVDAPVVQVVLAVPVVVEKYPWFRSCRNSWRFRSRSSSGGGCRCILQRHVVSRQ